MCFVCRKYERLLDFVREELVSVKFRMCCIECAVVHSCSKLDDRGSVARNTGDCLFCGYCDISLMLIRIKDIFDDITGSLCL